MWWPVYLSVLSTLLLCSWYWTAGPPRQSTTTNVEVHLIQQALPATLTVSRVNVSGERGHRTLDLETRGGRRHVVPRFMLDLYRQFNGGGRLPAADVIRSFTPKHTASLAVPGSRLHSWAGERRHLLVYDIPAPGAGEALEAAELRVLTDQQRTTQPDWDVSQLVGVSLLDDDVDVVPAKQVVRHEDAWVTFDVTPALRRRDAGKRTTLRLVVRIARGAGSDVTDVDVGTDVQPLLLLSYSTTQSSSPGRSRPRRSTEPEDYEEETNVLWDDDLMTSSRVAPTNRKLRRMRNMCRRRPLYVDFSVIHYDSWIVAPNGYEAFQCMGKCFFPVGDHLSPTKHAIVQTLLHSVAPGSVARACCVPTRLEPISVLYVDQRGVLTYRFSYQDMVVAECGCR